MPGIRPLLVVGAVITSLFALVGAATASTAQPHGTDDLLPVSLGEQGPAELRDAEFRPKGDEDVYGDAEGDTLELEFDTELDRVAEHADGQVTVSGEGGDDVTLQQSEALDFSVSGTELTLTATEPDGVTDVADIRYRRATIVDEVYDVNDFEVVVPEDGVGVDEKS